VATSAVGALGTVRGVAVVVAVGLVPASLVAVTPAGPEPAVNEALTKPVTGSTM
jgi:hypothetical protein